VRLWKSWIVTMKDFAVFRRKRYILYSLVALPLILSLLLPGTLLIGGALNEMPTTLMASLFRSEETIFVILPAILPSVIASYSFIGEKLEKSLEPLLATPTTDGELLLGKSLSAFVPSLAATYVGGLIFMVFADLLTYGRLGYLLFPDWTSAVLFVLAVPLACVLSVEFNVIVSSRVNDVRAAQQLGALIVLPMLAIYILGETGALSSGPIELLAVSGILLVADIALFYLSRAIFQREEILIKWR